MIRVNLLNDISGGGAEAQQGGISSQTTLSAMADAAESSNVDIVIKLLLLIFPLLFTFGYRQFLVNRAESERAALTARQKIVDEKLRGYQDALRDIEKFEEEKQVLNSQLAVIKNLSKERLKNVKSLDALQSIIPSSAWLDLLRIKGDKVDLEGFAVNDVVVSEFMQQLGSSIFFNHVILTDSVEASTSEGSVKRFKLKCSLGNI